MGARMNSEEAKGLRDQHLYCLEVLVKEVRVTIEDSRSSIASNKSGRNSLKLNRRTYLTSQSSRTRRRSTQDQVPEEKPLAPLRVGIDIFHMKDVYVHQVDLDKLYPPPQEDVSEDSETPPETPTSAKERVSYDPEEVLQEIDTENEEETTSKWSTGSKKSGSSTSRRSKISTSSKTTKSPGFDTKSAVSTTSSKSNSSKRKQSKVGVDATELEQALQALEEKCPTAEEQLEEAKLSKQLMAEERRVRRDRRRQEREQRAEDLRRRETALRRLQWTPDFRRGVSLLFTSTPEELIRQLMVSRLRLKVERWDGVSKPVTVGRSSLRLPGSYADLVHSTATGASSKQHAVHEDTTVVLDDDKEVGTVLLYLSLTCLGRAVTGSNLISECGLYSFIKACDRLPPCFKYDPATAFQSEGTTLKKVRHKIFTPSCRVNK